MGDSNGAYGELAAHDEELGELFGSYEMLPDRGENEALDSLLDRKNLSTGALVRVGARLSEPTVLAFGFPGGIRYRDLITDRRWVSPLAEWNELKIVRAGRTRSSEVLVAEGETDGARLTMLYPEVDVAIVPGSQSMTARYGPLYAAQLNVYDHVLVALDHRDTKGEEAAAILAEHLVVPSTRFKAPGDGDWCEWTGEAPPIPAAPAIDRAGGLVFEDLRGVLSGELKPPTMMVDDLLYEEGVHWLSGHPGSGKTTLAMASAHDVMLEDRHVVWLDYEGGLRGTLRRLKDVGVPDELLLGRFHYAGWPIDAPQYFGDIAARWPGALVIVDSASKAITLAGLDENSPGEVTKWVAPIVKACKDHHLPVIVIDHVTKNANGTSRYARGAGSKLADSDVAWYINTHTPFNREQKGVIVAKLQKDREGCLPFERWYEVGDGAGGLPVIPMDAPPPDASEPTAGSDQPAL